MRAHTTREYGTNVIRPCRLCPKDCRNRGLQQIVFAQTNYIINCVISHIWSRASYLIPILKAYWLNCWEITQMCQLVRWVSRMIGIPNLCGRSNTPHTFFAKQHQRLGNKTTRQQDNKTTRGTSSRRAPFRMVFLANICVQASLVRAIGTSVYSFFG